MELDKRPTVCEAPRRESAILRGDDTLYAEQVLQADAGCDFAILKPATRP
ncbi:MAG: hypothetical protein O7G88_19850 [bacterium]|nr:hypothetical protein [bacterium]